jgi:hypothetical protein
MWVVTTVGCKWITLRRRWTVGTLRAIRAASLALAVGYIALASVAQAQWVVTNTNDSGAGSLRQAILNADAAGAPTGAPGAMQTITFSGSGVGTIALTSGALPLIYTNVNIQGAPGVAIDGNNLYRGLFVSGLATTGNGAPSAIYLR